MTEDNSYQRFAPVSDLPEYSVWDNEEQRDLFPTKSGNRRYACRQCSGDTASLIADALNYYFVHHLIPMREAQKKRGETVV